MTRIPDPVGVTRKPVLPFPVEVFPAPLASFVREAAAALPCPPDFVGVPMLSLLDVLVAVAQK